MTRLEPAVPLLKGNVKSEVLFVNTLTQNSVPRVSRNFCDGRRTSSQAVVVVCALTSKGVVG